MTPPNDELARTPLYGAHLSLGGRMVPFAGWQMPVQFSGVKAEHLAVRSAAGLFDVSHMGEIELGGARATEVVNRVVTNAAGRLAVGRALYACACNERGTILDDLIVYHRGDERWLVVCNASNRDKIVAHFTAQAAGKCELRDATDETALMALQGPKALAIAALGGAEAARLGELPSFGLTEAPLFGVPCTVARTGYTGEDGVELFCAAEQAPTLYSALLESGAPLGLQPAGLGARDTLRLEARLCLYGNDIDETTNPLEAGLGWTVKLKKPEFIGKAALLAVKEQGLHRKLVGLQMTGRGIARHGYPLLDATGTEVGHCTSGSPAPSLGKNIGLGYLPLPLTAVGSEIMVDCRGRHITAVVVETPFYQRAS